MAGRGRGATLPAWMKDQGSNVDLNNVEKDQFENAPESRSREDRRQSSRYSSHRREKRSRSPRSRSPRRSHRRHSPRRRSPRRRSRSRRRSYERSSPRKSHSEGHRKRLPRKQRKPSNFDVYPEGVTDENAAAYATQAILQHNMAALQGAVGPASFGGAPPPAALALTGGGFPENHPQQTRHARRIYVGGIDDFVENELKVFFNDLIDTAMGEKQKGGSVMSIYINKERHFAFVELSTIELATACMDLDGIEYKGNPVKIRRPNDYNPSLLKGELKPLAQFDLSALGIVSTTVSDGPNKIYVGGIPPHLGEEQVKELLQAFGTLKSFCLVRDLGEELTKGYGFCEYLDPNVTDAAVEGLHNLALGDKTLSVRKASTMSESSLPKPQAKPAPITTVSGLPAPITPVTRILVLLNMITQEDLEDKEEYDDIVDDIKTECEKYGRVLSMTVPRPNEGYTNAVGKVFIEYDNIESSKKATTDLHGRGFASRTVHVDYLTEGKYASKELDN